MMSRALVFFVVGVLSGNVLAAGADLNAAEKSDGLVMWAWIVGILAFLGAIAYLRDKKDKGGEQ